MSTLRIYLYDFIHNLFQILSLSSDSSCVCGAPWGKELIQQFLCALVTHLLLWWGHAGRHVASAWQFALTSFSPTRIPNYYWDDCNAELAISYYFVLPLLRLIGDISQGHPMENWGGKLGGEESHNRVGWNSYAVHHTEEETMRKLGLLLRHNRLSAEDCLALPTLRCFVLQAWHKKDQTAYLCKTEGV